MPKISISTFQTKVGEAEASSRAKREADRIAQFEAMRVRIQTSRDAARHLINIAHIDACFEDLPSVISLASSNGFCAGLSLEKRRGLWQIGASHIDVLYRASQYGIGLSHQSFLIGHVLDAMGIRRSQESFQLLSQSCAWSKDPAVFRDQLTAAVGRVADSVRVALLCHGTQDVRLDMPAFEALGASRFEQIWNDVLIKAGVALDGSPGLDVGPPLRSAALKNRTGTLLFLLDAGADLEACRIPGLTALEGAASMGHQEAFFLLAKRGADVRVMNDQRETLLHKAVLAIPANPHGARAIIGHLIKSGLDPDQRDSSGQTPAGIASLFSDELSRKYEGEDDWRSSRDEAVAEDLMKILDHMA